MPCAGAKAGAAMSVTVKKKQTMTASKKTRDDDRNSNRRNDSPGTGRASPSRTLSPAGSSSPLRVESSVPGYKVESRIVDTKFKRKPKPTPPEDFDGLMLKVTAGAKMKNEMLASVATDPHEFHREANALRARLKAANRGLLDPNSKMMNFWDLVMLALLFYTATLTPFEVCFLWAETKRDALWVVNWVVNLLFITDMIFNFITPYEDPKLRSRVRNHAKIALHYVSTSTSYIWIEPAPIVPAPPACIAFGRKRL